MSHAEAAAAVPPELGGAPREELAYRLRQQRILADFGLIALGCRELDELLEAATKLCADGLLTRYCKVLEYLPAQNRFLVRAGVGWHEGVVGQATIGADLESPAGFAFKTARSVISNHLRSESRFRTPQLLEEHGIKRAINVVISGGADTPPFGVLEADSAQEGRFEEADLAFMQGFANLLGVAIDRYRVDQVSRQAEERQRLLTHELEHRIKNTLALVQALVSQTLRGAPSTAAAEEAISSRLVTLGRAHDILTQANWAAAPIRTVVEGALAPHDPGSRIDMSGSNLRLDAPMALSLSLALHELATNAAKYGALSNRTGQVDVTWEVVSHGTTGTLRLRWQERGGPPVSTPTHKGFGSRLIERSLGGEAGAQVTIEFAPAGLLCTIEAPLGTMTASEGAGRSAAVGASSLAAG